MKDKNIDKEKSGVVDEVVAVEVIVEEMKETNEEVSNITSGALATEKKEGWSKRIFLGLAYSIIPFLFFLIVQQLSWTGNMILGKPGAHPEIPLDDKIPLVSEFVWIYFLTFPIAIFTYFLVAYKDKKHLWNLWLTLMISFAISGIVYFFWQTEMVKPDLQPITLSDKFLIWTWGTCDPICCLPSQHCFMAFGIMLGVYNQKKNISPWLRWTLLTCGVLIVLATVFLKQHYVLDIVASFVIMIPMFFIIKRCKFGDHMVKKYGNWVWFGKNNKVKTDVTENKTCEIQNIDTLAQSSISETPADENEDVEIMADDMKGEDDAVGENLIEKADENEDKK